MGKMFSGFLSYPVHDYSLVRFACVMYMFTEYIYVCMLPNIAHIVHFINIMSAQLFL